MAFVVAISIFNLAICRAATPSLDEVVFDGYKFELKSVTNNIDGTSKWVYIVSAQNAKKDLSHWVLSLCDDLNNENIISASPDKWEVNTDPRTGIYGIKWDKSVAKKDGSLVCSFTMDKHYELADVTVAFKAGKNNYYETIQGPSCTILNPESENENEEEIENEGEIENEELLIGEDDQDGDGIINQDDDYPFDAKRAMVNNFPAAGYATLAFEDLWPSKGDYDFNDLVIDYKFKVVLSPQNKIVEVIGCFVTQAFGANMHNGFGFQFANNTLSENYMRVSGPELTEDYINVNSRGFEVGQNKPTIIVFDDCYDIMPGSAGIGCNTAKNCDYVTPDTIEVKIEFSELIYTLDDLDMENFNPFLIADGERGREIHLPDYAPTILFNKSYLGLVDDTSSPTIGRYFKTSTNLPWAIHIYEQFDYPAERQNITQTHTRFKDWAETGGASYPDWYLNKTGYRNVSNIYKGE